MEKSSKAEATHRLPWVRVLSLGILHLHSQAVPGGPGMHNVGWRMALRGL